MNYYVIIFKWWVIIIKNLRLSAASVGLGTSWVWVWEDVSTGNWLLVTTGNMSLSIATGLWNWSKSVKTTWSCEHIESGIIGIHTMIWHNRHKAMLLRNAHANAVLDNVLDLLQSSVWLSFDGIVLIWIRGNQIDLFWEFVLKSTRKGPGKHSNQKLTTYSHNGELDD